jgi:hypothetical protein
VGFFNFEAVITTMILPPQDLRIANLLSTPEGWIRVVGLSKLGIDAEPFPHVNERRKHISQIEPIPLTKQLAEQAGFVFKDDNIGTYYQSPLLISEENQIWYMKQNQGYIGTRGIK